MRFGNKSKHIFYSQFKFKDFCLLKKQYSVKNQTPDNSGVNGDF